jgi:hypothetical protein
MQESTDPESSKNDNEQDVAGSDSEATSKETLSDIEEKEEGLGSTSSEPDSGPSPDGALNENGEIKDAGPM